MFLPRSSTKPLRSSYQFSSKRSPNSTSEQEIYPFTLFCLYSDTLPLKSATLLSLVWISVISVTIFVPKIPFLWKNNNGVLFLLVWKLFFTFVKNTDIILTPGIGSLFSNISSLLRFSIQISMSVFWPSNLPSSYINILVRDFLMKIFWLINKIGQDVKIALNNIENLKPNLASQILKRMDEMDQQMAQNQVRTLQ